MPCHRLIKILVVADIHKPYIIHQFAYARISSLKQTVSIFYYSLILNVAFAGHNSLVSTIISYVHIFS